MSSAAGPCSVLALLLDHHIYVCSLSLRLIRRGKRESRTAFVDVVVVVTPPTAEGVLYYMGIWCVRGQAQYEKTR